MAIVCNFPFYTKRIFDLIIVDIVVKQVVVLKEVFLIRLSLTREQLADVSTEFTVSSVTESSAPEFVPPCDGISHSQTIKDVRAAPG